MENTNLEKYELKIKYKNKTIIEIIEDNVISLQHLLDILKENFKLFKNKIEDNDLSSIIENIEDFEDKSETFKYINIDDEFIITQHKMKKYKPKSKQELIELVGDESICLGDIDTSLITDMSNLFLYSKRKDFSGIETWNTSNVENMQGMFCCAKNFNHNINDWNVSKVKDMNGMFFCAKSFNQPLDNWDVSNVKYMSDMFRSAHKFNQPLDKWNVGNVTTMTAMFFNAEKFNQDLSNWNVSKVKFMIHMFACAENFDQDLSNWKLHENCDTYDMFYETKKMTFEKSPKIDFNHEAYLKTNLGFRD